MSQATLVFSGKLQNDIEFEVHTAMSFSGRSEIALFIKGEKEPFAIYSVDKKKTGSIECRPELNRKVLVVNKESSSVEEDVETPRTPRL